MPGEGEKRSAYRKRKFAPNYFTERNLRICRESQSESGRVGFVHCWWFRKD